MKKILCVAGARPNFIKISPLLNEFRKYAGIEVKLVHTGQHYDYNMSKCFFEALEISDPDFFLDIGACSDVEQIAKVMLGMEQLLLKDSYDLVIVVGDVNSTLAAAVAANKLSIPVAHVEAGLRSFNMKMQEEVNRILTDRISTFLFTHSESANENLRREGMKDYLLAGNVMIDTLKQFEKKAEESTVLERLDLKRKEYALATIHRPENVDCPETLSEILDAINHINKTTKVVFSIHPRTQKRMKSFGLNDKLKNIKLIDPLNYIDFISLVNNSKLVLTDSGGLQEETSGLNIPCLTLRNETERPVTLSIGTNMLAGNKKSSILKAYEKISNREIRRKGGIPYWDGKASSRIVSFLVENL